LSWVCFHVLILRLHDCPRQFHQISSERSLPQLIFQKIISFTQNKNYLNSVRRHARRNPSLLRNKTVVIKRWNCIANTCIRRKYPLKKQKYVEFIHAVIVMIPHMFISWLPVTS
jgi:hypothetical protein